MAREGRGVGVDGKCKAMFLGTVLSPEPALLTLPHMVVNFTDLDDAGSDAGELRRVAGVGEQAPSVKCLPPGCDHDFTPSKKC